jgi:hypothetical protein
MYECNWVFGGGFPILYILSIWNITFGYDPRGAYMGLNVYDMIPKGGIYGAKCTCNV